MAISKSTVSIDVSLNLSYARLRKHPTENDFIIIEDITGGQFDDEFSGQTIWLKVTADGTVSELSTAPSGVSAFTPSHSDWTKTGVYIKGNQVLIIRYSSSPFTDFSNAREATQYLLESNEDTLYISVDNSDNTLTAYE